MSSTTGRVVIGTTTLAALIAVIFAMTGPPSFRQQPSRPPSSPGVYAHKHPHKLKAKDHKACDSASELDQEPHLLTLQASAFLRDISKKNFSITYQVGNLPPGKDDFDSPFVESDDKKLVWSRDFYPYYRCDHASVTIDMGRNPEGLSYCSMWLDEKYLKSDMRVTRRLTCAA